MGHGTEFGVDPDKVPNSGLWRSPMLDLDQINAIKMTAQQYVDRTEHTFHPEAYSKKMGSIEEYQEMMTLVDFKGDPDHPEKVDLMRKHSMIFKPTGPQSRVFTQYEQAVNEAAYHICCLVPSAIFQKRNLAIMAKTVVRKTGLDFPNARANYFMSTVIPTSMDDDLIQKPAISAPASAVYMQQRSPRKESMKLLNDLSLQVIADTVMARASSIPAYKLKTREQCTLVENYVYTDAQRIMKYTAEQMDEAMDYIREVSAIYGRYPSGPSMPQPNLSPYEQGMNEAAAWLVRCQPALLIHRRQLTDLAKSILYSSGLHLPQSNRQPALQPVFIQGDYASATEADSQMIDSNAYITAQSAPTGPGLNSQGILVGYDDDEPAIAMENQELIRFLGGSMAIAQFTDMQLEDLGRAQFTMVDPRLEEEMATTGKDLHVEEDDRALDEAEILRISGCDRLEDVTALKVPACGFTSINAMDLACCVRLRELDLAENALRVFPRRLHLPRLRVLNLYGNRFFHLPLVEQFPQLQRLLIDEKLRTQLNYQMLAFFCPQLRQINDLFFDEVRSEFTTRVVQETRALSEPHIRAKWESDFSEMAHMRKLDCREAMLQTADKLVAHVRDRPLLTDDSLVRYRDLMMFRFVEDFLRVKFRGPNFNYANDLVFSAPLSAKTGTGPGDESHLFDSPADQSFERGFEAQAAAERALFDASNELMGYNLPDFVTWQSMQGQQMYPVCQVRFH
ncbi:hypothetical protein Ciccas_010904 [Cichlidogyrus casuarinus]|uniref:NAB co-repressor domain-containing protein n=1 Tax=Cichlidogyrus casuarinus TaxID=1844966 RepID=A0ABD2PTY7_9PLAT